MNLERLKIQLTKEEGYTLRPYVDTAGKITIGVGHNLTDKGLTPQQVNLILLDDISDSMRFVSSKLPWSSSLDEVRQRVLIDMTFNLGAKILQFKKFLAATEATEWQNAATEMLDSTWAHQVGQRATNLAYMMLTGQDL